MAVWKYWTKIIATFYALNILYLVNTTILQRAVSFDVFFASFLSFSFPNHVHIHGSRYAPAILAVVISSLLYCTFYLLMGPRPILLLVLMLEEYSAVCCTDQKLLASLQSVVTGRERQTYRLTNRQTSNNDGPEFWIIPVVFSHYSWNNI